MGRLAAKEAEEPSSLFDRHRVRDLAILLARKNSFVEQCVFGRVRPACDDSIGVLIGTSEVAAAVFSRTSSGLEGLLKQVLHAVTEKLLTQIANATESCSTRMQFKMQAET
jgi:hypothetical protein